MKFLKNSKGFTLAEMLIVMAVVVILAAAAIPAVGNQTEMAKQSNDLALLRDMYTQAYVQAAVEEAGGATTLSDVEVAGTFDVGKFDKLGAPSVGGFSVSDVTIGAGNKTVVFKFTKVSSGGVTLATSGAIAAKA